MGLARDQVAPLHQRRQGGRHGDHPRHGQTHQQVRSNEQFAVVQVSHGHASKGADGHHRQQDASPEVVALSEFALDQFFALLWCPGAGFLRLDSQVESPATHGQQAPFGEGVHEIQAERQGGQHRT